VEAERDFSFYYLASFIGAGRDERPRLLSVSVRVLVLLLLLSLLREREREREGETRHECAMFMALLAVRRFPLSNFPLISY